MFIRRSKNSSMSEGGGVCILGGQALASTNILRCLWFLCRAVMYTP